MKYALLLPFLLSLGIYLVMGAEAAPAGWKLAWCDEFDGPELDRSKWGFESGNGFKAEEGMWIGGWGNDELQFYTSRPANAFTKDGALHIRALKDDYFGCAYTSARVHTKGHFAKCFGRIEFKAKLPPGQGLWPALWLLPADNVYGSWAASGEIDVLEARGQEPNKVLGTIHYGSRWPANEHSGGEYQFPAGADFTIYHIYAIEWDSSAIRWYVDGKLYSTKSDWWSCSKVDAKQQGIRPQTDAGKNPKPAPFDRPFYLIMNLAVGGNFVGAVGKDTVFPAEMMVDYVRVYDLQPKGVKQ
ncbi:MAG: glycoside hydrolase family 16 protein [Verrucomicrobiota bacterium]